MGSGLESITFNLMASGGSLARFGDGELKLVHGEDSLTQTYSDDIRNELLPILWGDTPCHVGIPHAKGKRPDYWKDFLNTHSSYTNPNYGYVSAFISRPDEAEVPDISPLWEKKAVVLVGNGTSLNPDHLEGATDVKFIECPERDAYSEVDSLEEEIGTPSFCILCCGATATVLAHRLSCKGVQALDLGFAGKFM